MSYHQDKLSFFIIIKEGFNTHQLKIPSKFVKHLNEEISRNAFLLGPSGDRWQVTISMKGNEMYMLNGWPQFLAGNSVNPDEFLLFKYHRDNSFKVQIFSTSGCERLYLQAGRQTEAPSTPCFERTRKPRKPKTSIGSSYLHKSMPSQRGLHFSKKGSVSKSYSKPKIDKSEARRLAESVSSGKPYWIHGMTKSNVEDRCLLPIATEFARTYLTEAVKMVILWNTEGGKYWEVTVTWIHSHSQNKRYSQLTKGWGEFVRDNKLKKGDICMFELEEINHLKVHIFRCDPISLI